MNTGRKVLLTMCAVVLCAAAQQKPFSGTPDLEHSLRALNELGSVLVIAAHPDDERSDVLAYFARGRHMRAAYLSLTRGEGGQNLIGPEQGAQLGVIRTQELLDARKIDGAEQFFTRAIDFGFSKSAAETMEKWDRGRVLGDVVWVIRRYRPDVLITVFTGTPFDGHGQHQVSALFAKEAFRAAGDPQRFPEQLKWVTPWQAKRIVHAGFPPEFRMGETDKTLQAAGSIPTGELNPVVGYSYQELAVLSRSMHHSQGTGAMRRLGPSHVDFALVDGEPAAKDVFDGIDTTWNRIAGGTSVGPMLEEAIRTFSPSHPERTIPLLVKARVAIAKLDDPLARIKLRETDDAIAACGGIFAEAQARTPDVSPGEMLQVTTTVLNRSDVEVKLTGARMEGIFEEDMAAKPAALGLNQSATVEFSREVPKTQAYSQP